MSVSTQKYKPPAVEKPKPKARNLSHSQMAAEWEANGRDRFGKVIKFVEKPKGWSKDDINRARDRALDEQRRAAAGPPPIAAADAGEESDAPLAAGEPADVLARMRMGELALALQGLVVGTGTPPPALPPPPPPPPIAAGADGGGGLEEGGGASHEALCEMAEGRRAQLDELECLAAMFPDEFLLLTPTDAIEALRERLEAIGEDAASADAAAMVEVARGPPLEFALLLTAHGARKPPAADTPDEAADGADAPAPIPLVASILLRVGFPPRYPHVPPTVGIEDSMVVTTAALPPTKVLTSLAVLDEGALLSEFGRVAEEILPSPCVYEAASWLTENAFDFVGQAWI